MNPSTLIAGGALALALLNGKKASAQERSSREPEAAGDGSVAADVGAVAGAVGGVASLIPAGIGGGTAVTGGTAVGTGTASGTGTAAGVAGGTILGVSAGFVIVGGLWALAFIVSQVVSRVMGPEIDRRRTLPAWLTSEPWGFAWRSAREFWLSATLSKFPPGGLVRVGPYRWVDGDGRYGDLNFQGGLESIVMQGQTPPPQDRFAFYDWLQWAHARRAGDMPLELIQAENGAHFLARRFGTSFLIAARALSQYSGQSGPDSTPLASLAAEGVTPAGAGSTQEVPNDNVPVADVMAAIRAGCAAGIGLSRSSYREGGVWIFASVSRSGAATAVAGAYRAAGMPWVSAQGSEVVFGTAGAVGMPGDMP